MKTKSRIKKVKKGKCYVVITLTEGIDHFMSVELGEDINVTVYPEEQQIQIAIDDIEVVK